MSNLSSMHEAGPSLRLGMPELTAGVAAFVIAAGVAEVAQANASPNSYRSASGHIALEGAKQIDFDSFRATEIKRKDDGKARESSLVCVIKGNGNKQDLPGSGKSESRSQRTPRIIRDGLSNLTTYNISNRRGNRTKLPVVGPQPCEPNKDRPSLPSTKPRRPL